MPHRSIPSGPGSRAEQAAFIGFKGFNTLRLANGKPAVEVPMVGRIVADDLEATKALAVLGEGIAWLPDFLAADAVEAGTLVSVLPNWKSATMGKIYFVYAGRQYTSPKVQAFIQTALDVVAPENQNHPGHRAGAC
jgi:DNA-binding transcriptional LysR family regulator